MPASHAHPWNLPWLGLGLSSNLSAGRPPHPYRLWDAHPFCFDYVEYSAPLALAEARRQASLFEEMWKRRDRLPVLLHPVHLNLYGPELESEAALEALAEHATEVGSRWVSNDVAWWHARGHFFPGYLYVAPPLSEAAIEDCALHVRHVQRRLPMPLAIENPAVIARRGPLHVLSFMAALSDRTDAPLLLDLGHLLSHQLAHDLPLDAGLDDFPLERVIEIHVAGGTPIEHDGRRLYVDDHSRPVPEALFALLAQLVPRCPQLRAVTYEGDGHTRAVAHADLERLRTHVRPPDPAPAPSPAAAGADPACSPARAAGTGEPPTRSLPLRVFADCYAGEPAAGDPIGVAVERSLRRLAVAERIDRVFPLTRGLLAGDDAGLAAFTAAPEFRDAFVASGAPHRDTPQCFARFARRRVRERGDEALATLLAFETWAVEQLASRPGRPALVHARFPLDLSAILHATSAAHVAADADARRREPADPETVRRLVRNAPVGPWPVAIERAAGRILIRDARAGAARPGPIP